MAIQLNPNVTITEDNLKQVFSYFSVKELGRFCLVSKTTQKCVDFYFNQRFTVHSDKEIAQRFQEFVSKVPLNQVAQFTCYSTSLSRNCVDVKFGWRWSSNDCDENGEAQLKAVLIFRQKLENNPDKNLTAFGHSGPIAIGSSYLRLFQKGSFELPREQEDNVDTNAEIENILNGKPTVSNEWNLSEEIQKKLGTRTDELTEEAKSIHT